MTQDPEIIGPARAQELVDNRHPSTRSPVYRKWQGEFAERMKDGTWQREGYLDEIILDEEGRMLDGVQRMMAVILADVEVEFLVRRVKAEPLKLDKNFREEFDKTYVLEKKEPIPPQEDLWTTGERGQIRICDMKDDHLLNTLRMLRRNGLRRRLELGNEEEDGPDWEESSSPSWQKMLLEAERRGGETWSTAQRIKDAEDLGRKPFDRHR